MLARSKSRRQRRRLIAIGSSGLFAMGIVGAACSPFDAVTTSSPTATDGATADQGETGTTNDGDRPNSISHTDATAGTDAESIEASADGGLACFDFTLSDNGFGSDGNAKYTTGTGFLLSVGPGQSGRVFKTFQMATKGAISKTTLSFHIKATNAGTFQAEPGNYLDFFAQYLGTKTDYKANPGMEIEALKNKLEVNVWPEADDFDTTYGATITQPLAVTDIRLDTNWSTGASVMTVQDATTVAINAQSTTTGTRKDFTIALGGGATGSTSTITMTVLSICVAMQ